MKILEIIAMVFLVGLAAHVYAAVCMGIVGILVEFGDPESWEHEKALNIVLAPVLLGVFMFIFATWPAIEELRQELAEFREELSRDPITVAFRTRVRMWRRRLTALVRDSR